MYKVLFRNVVEEKYRGTVKYDIEFPECIKDDQEFCKAFLDSLDEKIQALIIEMGLKYN